MAKAEEQEKKPEVRYYWTPSARCQLGNFIPERKSDSGHILSPEQSFEITDHICITSDPKVIKFIESHHAFKSKTIIRCDTLREAQLKTAQQQLLRSQTQRTSESSLGFKPNEVPAVGAVVD